MHTTEQTVRAAALVEAADEVHTEARWTAEMITRGTPPDPVDRLLVVETILRDRAAALTPPENGTADD